MKNKIIIFDMDGVLFDTNEIASRHMSLRFPGISEETKLELLTGNFHQELEKLSLERAQESEEQKLERQVRYVKEKSEAPMYDGMKELLEGLHQDGYTIALNTSAWERNCFPLLERAGLVDLFDFLGTAEVSKSKEEKFNILKDRYQSDIKDMLFVTDTLGDVREADAAGVSTVAVTWGAHNESYFHRETHQNLKKIVSSVAELERFIREY